MTFSFNLPHLDIEGHIASGPEVELAGLDFYTDNHRIELALCKNFRLLFRRDHLGLTIRFGPLFFTRH